MSKSQRVLFQKVWAATQRQARRGQVPHRYINRPVYDLSLLVGRSDMGRYGAPFPKRVLSGLTRVSGQLKTHFPFLFVMKPSQYHASVFSVYRDKPRKFPKRYPNSKRLKDYARVADVLRRMNPFRVQWKGLNLSSDGTIFVEGHVQDATLARLRRALYKSHPKGDGTRGNFFHISVARLSRQLSLEQFHRLLAWVERNRHASIGIQRIDRLAWVVTRDHAGALVDRKWQRELSGFIE